MSLCSWSRTQSLPLWKLEIDKKILQPRVSLATMLQCKEVLTLVTLSTHTQTRTRIFGSGFQIWPDCQMFGCQWPKKDGFCLVFKHSLFRVSLYFSGGISGIYTTVHFSYSVLTNRNCSNSKFSLLAGENASFECGNQAKCRQFNLMLFQHCETWNGELHVLVIFFFFFFNFFFFFFL